MTAKVAGILLAALTLTGCVQAVEPPAPGFTEADLVAYGIRQGDLLWVNTGLSDAERPEIGEISFYGIGTDWADEFVRCMNDAGFSEYEATSAGYSVQGVTGENTVVPEYICTATNQLDPRDIFPNPAQIEYLYDYYQRSLVPCLESAG